VKNTRFSQAKYLGVVIDNKLSWQPHGGYLRAKIKSAAKTLYLLLCGKNKLSLRNKRQLNVLYPANNDMRFCCLDLRLHCNSVDTSNATEQTAGLCKIKLFTGACGWALLSSSRIYILYCAEKVNFCCAIREGFMCCLKLILFFHFGGKNLNNFRKIKFALCVDSLPSFTKNIDCNKTNNTFQQRKFIWVSIYILSFGSCLG
jgi:hypothetical protein